MTNSFGNFQAQWSNQNQFWAWMDSNGNVYASDSMSGARQIGVSVEKYKRMESIANEALAAFVMGNCPTLCPEIKAVLAKWSASKKAA